MFPLYKPRECSSGQVLGDWGCGKPPGRPQPGQDSEGKTPGPKDGRVRAPHPGLSSPVQHPHTDSSPLGRSRALLLGQSAALTVLPPQRKEKGRARPPGAPSQNVWLGQWGAAAITFSPGSNSRRCSLDRAQEPRGQWDTKMGQGVSCRPSTPRAAWQPPPQEPHLRGLQLQN